MNPGVTPEESPPEAEADTKADELDGVADALDTVQAALDALDTDDLDRAEELATALDGHDRVGTD